MTDVIFPNPVFQGDTIRLRSKVLSARESKSRPTTGIVEFEHVPGISMAKSWPNAAARR